MEAYSYYPSNNSTFYPCTTYSTNSFLNYFLGLQKVEDYFKKGFTAQDSLTIDSLLELVKVQFKVLYVEIEKHKISKEFIQYLFKLTLAFVVKNRNKISGKKSEKTNFLLKNLRQELYWIVLVLDGAGVCDKRINEILTILIGFTLDHLDTYPLSIK